MILSWYEMQSHRLFYKFDKSVIFYHLFQFLWIWWRFDSDSVLKSYLFLLFNNWSYNLKMSYFQSKIFPGIFPEASWCICESEFSSFAKPVKLKNLKISQKLTLLADLTVLSAVCRYIYYFRNFLYSSVVLLPHTLALIARKIWCLLKSKHALFVQIYQYFIVYQKYKTDLWVCRLICHFAIHEKSLVGERFPRTPKS